MLDIIVPVSPRTNGCPGKPGAAHDYVVETLAADDAVLVIHEAGFLKQGRASCGAGRQYTGSAGKITNCQIGVFAALVSRHGHAFIDPALYLPKAWTDDTVRMAAAHVPQAASFATKPGLAAGMAESASSRSARQPFSDESVAVMLALVNNPGQPIWTRPQRFAITPASRAPG